MWALANQDDVIQVRYMLRRYAITTFVFFPHHESLTCTCKVHVHVNVEPTNCFVLIRAIERGTDAFYVKRTGQLLYQLRFTCATWSKNRDKHVFVHVLWNWETCEHGCSKMRRRVNMVVARNWETCEHGCSKNRVEHAYSRTIYLQNVNYFNYLLLI